MPNPDIFYDHLDVCSQCERNPFDLCPEGARLIRKAATGVDIPTGPRPTMPPMPKIRTGTPLDELLKIVFDV